MKLCINLSLRKALLACMTTATAFFASTSWSAETYMAEGVDADHLLNSERFYDNGKGYYWTWTNYIPYKGATNLYKTTGSYAFLGDLAQRVGTSSGISSSTFKNLTSDANTCWYNVSSNIIQYWQGYYGVFGEDVIYGYTYNKDYADDLGGTQSLKLGMYFYDNWANQGGNLQMGAGWYLKGDSAVQNELGSGLLKYAGKGGFFAKYFDEDESAARYSYASSFGVSDFADVLASHLGLEKQPDGDYKLVSPGQIADISICYRKGGVRYGHALTCYGFTVGDDGLIESLKLTNSDDQEYKLFTLYVKYVDGEYRLYEDAAYDKEWQYAEETWTIESISSIATPELLQQMYEKYNDADNPLVWTGGATTWSTSASPVGVKLPDATDGWAVEVGGEMYNAFGDTARKVSFDDRASSGKVTVRGEVSSAEMRLLNNSLDYTFTGTSSALVHAERLLANGGGSALFNNVTLSGETIQMNHYTMELGSGSRMNYEVAELSSGAVLAFNGGSASFDSLTLGSYSSLFIGANASLAADTLICKGDVVFNFTKAGALLDVDGSLSAESPIRIDFTGTAVSGASYALVRFEDGLSNWEHLFRSSFGTLSYSNNTLYLNYTPIVQETFGRDFSAISSALNNAALTFDGSTAGNVVVDGTASVYAITMTAGSYVLKNGSSPGSLNVESSITVSGDADLESQLSTLEGNLIYLEDHARLTLSSAANSTISLLFAEDDTTVHIKAGTSVTFDEVKAMGALVVDTNATAIFANEADVTIAGAISGGGSVQFTNGGEVASVVYTLAGAEQIYSDITVGSADSALAPRVTLAVPSAETGKFSILADGELCLLQSGSFAATATGDGWLTVADGASIRFDVQAAAASFASTLNLQVQGSAIVGSETNLFSGKLASDVEVSGKLTVHAMPGSVSLDSVLLNGGHVHFDDVFENGKGYMVAPFFHSIGSLYVGEEGGTISNDHRQGYYAFRSNTDIAALAGSGHLHLQSESHDTLNLFRIASVGTEGFEGHITLQHGNEAGYASGYYQSSVLELGDVQMGGRIYIRTLSPADAIKNLFITALGIDGNATIGGLDSLENPATQVFLYSGCIKDSTREMRSSEAFSSFIEEDEHTLTVQSDSNHRFAGTVLGSLSLVKKGKGEQAFTGDMGAFDGSVDVQGGTLRVRDSLAAASVCVDNAALVAESHLNTGSGLTMNGGSLSASTLTTAVGEFSGVNHISADATTSSTWTLNLTTEHADKAVITLSGALSLTTLVLKYDEAQMYPTDYVLLRSEEEISLTTLPQGSWWVTETIEGTLYHTLLFNLTNGKLLMPRNTPATLTWEADAGVWAKEQGHDEQCWSAAVQNRNFYDGDTVVFNAAADVTIDGVVKPAVVTVCNNGGAVSFTGSGKISGETSLAKSGDGVLDIYTANDYTGGTTLSAGELVVHHAAALGSGSVSLNGGVLRNSTDAPVQLTEGTVTLGGAFLVGDFTIAGSDGWEVTQDTQIVGSLSLSGNGALSLLNGATLCITDTLSLGDFELNFSGSYKHGESYTLISAGSIEGDVSELVYTGTGKHAFDIIDGSLVVTIGGNHLMWSDYKGTVWQVGADGWIDFDAWGPAAYNDGDVVEIGDGIVAIVGDVAPGSVLLNPYKALTLQTKYDKKTGSYSGAIVGNTAITIEADEKAKVTMNDGNSYQGGTIIASGTVVAGGASSFGTGDIAVSDGATLDLNGKAVGNNISAAGEVTIRGGNKFTGDFTMADGSELMKGSLLNVEGVAELHSGVLHGTLSGKGEVHLIGSANGSYGETAILEIENSGKLLVDKLTIDYGAALMVQPLAGLFNAKSTQIVINGGDLLSTRNVSAHSLTMTEGFFTVENPTKALSVNFGGDMILNAEDNTPMCSPSVTILGKLSVGGDLSMQSASLSMYFYNRSYVAQNLTVKGDVLMSAATLADGTPDVVSRISVAGAMSANSLTLCDASTIDLYGTTSSSLSLTGKTATSLIQEQSLVNVSGNMNVEGNLTLKDSSINLDTSYGLKPKAMNMTVKGALEVSGKKDDETSSIFINGKLSAGSVQMTNGASLCAEQDIALTNKNATNTLTSSNMYGSNVSVVGNLSLLEHSYIYLMDYGRKKAWNLTVAGALTALSSSKDEVNDIQLSGKLSAGSLSLKHAEILLENITPQSITLTGKNITNTLTSSVIDAIASMSVNGALSLTDSQLILLDDYDPYEVPKKMASLGLTVKDALTVSDSLRDEEAEIRISGKLSAGSLTMENAELMLQSATPQSITLSGKNTVNTLTSSIIDADASMSAVSDLTLVDSSISLLDDGDLFMDFDKRKALGLSVNGTLSISDSMKDEHPELYVTGKLSAGSMQLSNADVHLENFDAAQSMMLTQSKDASKQMVVNSFSHSSLHVSGSVTVAGSLVADDTDIYLEDIAWEKAMGFTVKNDLSLINGSELSLTGKLSTVSLQMRDSNILLAYATPQSITVSGKNIVNTLTSSSIDADASMSVNGGLKLSDSSISLQDDGDPEKLPNKKKALGLTVKGAVEIADTDKDATNELYLTGKLTAASMQLTNADIMLANDLAAQGITLTQNKDASKQLVLNTFTNSRVTAHGNMSVAGSLALVSSDIALSDPAKGKNMGLTVKGDLSLKEHSAISLTGSLNAASLQMAGSGITLTHATPQSITLSDKNAMNALVASTIDADASMSVNGGLALTDSSISLQDDGDPEKLPTKKKALGLTVKGSLEIADTAKDDAAELRLTGKLSAASMQLTNADIMLANDLAAQGITLTQNKDASKQLVLNTFTNSRVTAHGNMSVAGSLALVSSDIALSDPAKGKNMGLTVKGDLSLKEHSAISLTGSLNAASLQMAGSGITLTHATPQSITLSDKNAMNALVASTIDADASMSVNGGLALTDSSISLQDDGDPEKLPTKKKALGLTVKGSLEIADTAKDDAAELRLTGKLSAASMQLTNADIMLANDLAAQGITLTQNKDASKQLVLNTFTNSRVTAHGNMSVAGSLALVSSDIALSDPAKGKNMGLTVKGDLSLKEHSAISLTGSLNAASLQMAGSGITLTHATPQSITLSDKNAMNALVASTIDADASMSVNGGLALTDSSISLQDDGDPEKLPTKKKALGLTVKGSLEIADTAKDDAAELRLTGKLSAASMQLTNADIMLANDLAAQGITLTQNKDASKQLVLNTFTNSRVTAHGNMSVAGSLALVSSDIALSDPAKGKNMGLTVKGDLSLKEHSAISLTGSLNAASLQMAGSGITLTHATPQSITLSDKNAMNALVASTIDADASMSVNGGLALTDSSISLQDDGDPEKLPTKKKALGLTVKGSLEIADTAKDDAAELRLTGKLSAASMQLTNADIMLANDLAAQGITLTQNKDASKQLVLNTFTNSRVTAHGNMSVAGSLALVSSDIALSDPAKGKNMGLTVKGDLSLKEQSSITLTGGLNVASLQMEQSDISLTHATPQSITLSDKNATNALVASTIDADASMSVNGGLKLSDSSITLQDDGDPEKLPTKKKALGLTVKGALEIADTTKDTANELYLTGKLTAASMQLSNADIMLANDLAAQGISLTQSKDTLKQPIINTFTNSKLYANGSMSVAGTLVLNATTIKLEDKSAKPKSMNLSVAGDLLLGSGSSISLSGVLSSTNMTLEAGSSIHLTSTTLQTIKVGKELTFNGNISLGLQDGLNITMGKTYNLITFRTLVGVDENTNLYNLLNLNDDYCTLTLDSNKKAITLKVTETEWNKWVEDHAMEAMPAVAMFARAANEPIITTSAAVEEANPEAAAEEKAEEKSAIITTLPVQQVLDISELLDKVSDTLVQTTWGSAKASRAFVDSIGNRGQNAASFADGRGAAWGSVIGATSRLSSHGSSLGADHSLSGAVFGAEINATPKHNIGLAMGVTWGEISTLSAYKVDQNSTHFAAYGQSRLGKNFALDWSAAYGRSENDADILGSRYDWTQHALQLDARLSYGYALNERTILRGFGGMQYLHVDSTTPEKGMKADSMQNVRVELGAGLTYMATAKTSLYGEVSFIGDIVRDNPATHIGGTCRSGSNPGRAGMNMTVGAMHALNESWSLNANYNMELLPRANSHNASVGATYHF